MELVHGGDWAGYRAEFGRDALDFSANVSPLGLPAGVAAAITAALPMADRYPDPLCRALRTKLAAAEGVDTAQILCGNGAADLIYRLALALRPRRALLPAPTFAEYAAALETVDCWAGRGTLHRCCRRWRLQSRPSRQSRFPPAKAAAPLCRLWRGVGRG